MWAGKPQAQYSKSHFEKVDTPSIVSSWFSRNDSIALPDVKRSGSIRDCLAIDWKSVSQIIIAKSITPVVVTRRIGL